MDAGTNSRTVNIYIAVKPDTVVGFVSNPLNLPLWAKGFCTAVTRQNEDWMVETPQGQVKVRFVPQNSYGVLDHYLTLPSGQEVYAPMRAIANGSGTEVLFTLLRSPDMSDDQFNEDAAMVEQDLHALKSMLEKRSVIQ